MLGVKKFGFKEILVQKILEPEKFWVKKIKTGQYLIWPVLIWPDLAWLGLSWLTLQIHPDTPHTPFGHPRDTTQTLSRHSYTPFRICKTLARHPPHTCQTPTRHLQKTATHAQNSLWTISKHPSEFKKILNLSDTSQTPLRDHPDTLLASSRHHSDTFHTPSIDLLDTLCTTTKHPPDTLGLSFQKELGAGLYLLLLLFLWQREDKVNSYSNQLKLS